MDQQRRVQTILTRVLISSCYERRYLMNAAIPSNTNARMMTQTSAIATVMPADIVVMSIILDWLPEMKSLRDLSFSRRLAKRQSGQEFNLVTVCFA
jgi:hypothetical protein